MTRRLTRPLVKSWLKPRPANAHKGTSGRVLIVAGSRGMVGAAVLCAEGAERSGAGLVKLATVASQQTVAAKRAPLESTTMALPEDRAGRLSEAGVKKFFHLVNEWRPTVIACGPGLGVTPAIKKMVKKLLFENTTPVVLDADGLNALSQLKIKKKVRAPLVMTPHAGEMARLLGSGAARIQSDREASVKRAAKLFGAVCLLKGPGTLISDGQTTYKNTTGNPAMASGGMGDVLTGVIAATWAQGSTALRAAAIGAFMHGWAGDLAKKVYPERTLLASDVANALPKAFKFIWRKL